MNISESTNSLISNRAIDNGVNKVVHLQVFKQNKINNAKRLLEGMIEKYNKKFKNTGVYIETPKAILEDPIYMALCKDNGIEFYNDGKEYRV